MIHEIQNDEAPACSDLGRGEIWMAILCLSSSLFCGGLWVFLLLCPHILHASH